MHDKKLVLRDVWRTCNKIRAAIFRIKGLQLYDFFCPFDPHKNGVIKESEFISVFAHQLREAIGLTDQEIIDLADYFRVQDGRILYSQLCEVIQKEPDFRKNPDLVSGLEWEDPLHVNRISHTEQRRFCLLLTKIATVVNMRKLVLRPYFQDYELIAKNVGVVTIAHFARVLSFLKILLSAADFNLLVKKYIKDSYTVNYVAFLKDLDNAVKYMNENEMLDVGGDLLSLFPGRIINAELPKLPRPEIGRINPASVFGTQSVFHPILVSPVEQEALINVIRRIQRHVLVNRVRIKEFFKDFDPLNCGRCTVAQFRRGLDALGVSKLGRLFISPQEYDSLTVQYKDPADPSRVCYDTFETDIETVFTTRELEKYPSLRLEVPPKEVMELPRKGGKDWQVVTTERRDLCEEALDKVKRKTNARRIILKPFFQDFDKFNSGHCSRAQLRQVISAGGILLTNQEIYALEERYNDDVGFNYNWFLKEVDCRKIEEPLFNKYAQSIKALNAPRKPRKPERKESDIVCILAKIKGKIVREGVRPIEFLRFFDKTNKGIICRNDFIRALDTCRLDLTQTEYETLMNVFASSFRNECIEYVKFNNSVTEALTQNCLERAPLIVPLQHVPTRECDRNFLNFEERAKLSLAMKKISRSPDLMVDFTSLFKDYDKTNCGTVSQAQFMKILSVRNVLHHISPMEFEIVCKCFGFERGMRDEVDYRAFCKTIDLIYETSKQLPF